MQVNGVQSYIKPYWLSLCGYLLKPRVNHFNSEMPKRFLVAARDANVNASVLIHLDSARQQIERHITDHGLLQRIIIQA